MSQNKILITKKNKNNNRFVLKINKCRSNSNKENNNKYKNKRYKKNK